MKSRIPPEWGKARSSKETSTYDILRHRCWTRAMQDVEFRESDKGEVRAEARPGKARNWSEGGNRTAGYSSTNSSTGTPYALAIFVTVGM